MVSASKDLARSSAAETFQEREPLGLAASAALTTGGFFLSSGIAFAALSLLDGTAGLDFDNLGRREWGLVALTTIIAGGALSQVGGGVGENLAAGSFVALGFAGLGILIPDLFDVSTDEMSMTTPSGVARNTATNVR